MKIEVETYEEYRRHFFAEQKARAQKRYDRLLKRYADYPSMSIEAQRVQDAGRELQLYEDVCGMLEKAHGEWQFDENGMDWGIGAWRCSLCGCNNHNIPQERGIVPLQWAGAKYCPNCGAKMKGNINR